MKCKEYHEEKERSNETPRKQICKDGTWDVPPILCEPGQDNIVLKFNIQYNIHLSRGKLWNILSNRHNSDKRVFNQLLNSLSEDNYPPTDHVLINNDINEVLDNIPKDFYNYPTNNIPISPKDLISINNSDHPLNLNQSTSVSSDVLNGIASVWKDYLYKPTNLTSFVNGSSDLLNNESNAKTPNITTAVIYNIPNQFPNNIAVVDVANDVENTSNESLDNTNVKEPKYDLDLRFVYTM